MSGRRSSGQLLIMGLLILAFLMASIPALLSFAGYLQKRFVDSTNSLRVSQVAQAGFAEVTELFDTHPEAWGQALRGDAALSELGLDGVHQFTGLKNTPYTVRCAHDDKLLPDQLRVSITVLLPSKASQKERVFQSLFSPAPWAWISRGWRTRRRRFTRSTIFDSMARVPGRRSSPCIGDRLFASAR